jgi:hypothetical protein
LLPLHRLVCLRASWDEWRECWTADGLWFHTLSFRRAESQDHDRSRFVANGRCCNLEWADDVSVIRLTHFDLAPKIWVAEKEDRVTMFWLQ